MGDADGRNLELLMAVAPHMLVQHDIHDLLQELIRLVDTSPGSVAEVLRTVVDARGPIYDYEDRLITLVRRLNELGQREAALYSCNKLIALPGMAELFRELKAPR